MTEPARVSPISVKIPDEIAEKLDAVVGLSNFLGDPVTRSEVVRQALEGFLDSYVEGFKERAREKLNETPKP